MTRWLCVLVLACGGVSLFRLGCVWLFGCLLAWLFVVVFVGVFL